jgi:DNA-binding CsgD family transcriptional regulator
MAHGSVPQPQERDVHAVLRIVEAVSRANTLADFRLATLDALARELDYRDLTFFVGRTVEEAFADPAPAVLGRAGRMLEQYTGRWWREDVYARPRALALFRHRSVIALRELPRPVGADERRYVEQFLVANRIEDELGVKFDTHSNGVALMGVLGDGRRPFDARDVARLELLSGPLSSILRFYLRPERSIAAAPALTAREHEVAELVAGGLTNREIACTLCIGEPTVKKHVTRALAATGCTSRTQLAIAWRTGVTPAGSPAPAAAPAPRGPSPA